MRARTTRASACSLPGAAPARGGTCAWLVRLRRGRGVPSVTACAAVCKVASVTFVLITGATRGIGRAAAIELARQGAELALVGREAARVRTVAQQARAAGGGAAVHEHVADLTLMSEVRALAEEVRERHERVEVLANNAGAMFASRAQTSE